MSSLRLALKQSLAEAGGGGNSLSGGGSGSGSGGDPSPPKSKLGSGKGRGGKSSRSKSKSKSGRSSSKIKSSSSSSLSKSKLKSKSSDKNKNLTKEERERRRQRQKLKQKQRSKSIDDKARDKDKEKDSHRFKSSKSKPSKSPMVGAPGVSTSAGVARSSSHGVSSSMSTSSKKKNDKAKLKAKIKTSSSSSSTSAQRVLHKLKKRKKHSMSRQEHSNSQHSGMVMESSISLIKQQRKKEKRGKKRKLEKSMLSNHQEGNSRDGAGTGAPDGGDSPKSAVRRRILEHGAQMQMAMESTGSVSNAGNTSTDNPNGSSNTAPAPVPTIQSLNHYLNHPSASASTSANTMSGVGRSERVPSQSQSRVGMNIGMGERESETEEYKKQRRNNNDQDSYSDMRSNASRSRSRSGSFGSHSSSSSSSSGSAMSGDDDSSSSSDGSSGSSSNSDDDSVTVSASDSGSDSSSDDESDSASDDSESDSDESHSHVSDTDDDDDDGSDSGIRSQVSRMSRTSRNSRNSRVSRASRASAQSRSRSGSSRPASVTSTSTKRSKIKKVRKQDMEGVFDSERSSDDDDDEEEDDSDDDDDEEGSVEEQRQKYSLGDDDAKDDDPSISDGDGTSSPSPNKLRLNIHIGSGSRRNSSNSLPTLQHQQTQVPSVHAATTGVDTSMKTSTNSSVHHQNVPMHINTSSSAQVTSIPSQSPLASAELGNAETQFAHINTTSTTTNSTNDPTSSSDAAISSTSAPLLSSNVPSITSKTNNKYDASSNLGSSHPNAGVSVVASKEVETRPGSPLLKKKKVQQQLQQQHQQHQQLQQRTVPAPTQQVLAWVMGMSQGKQRRKISVGMRVKVRFVKPTVKWYGGLVSAVATGGEKIRIKYDDGNKEVANFPDKEIVVDDEGNGQHKAGVDARAFIPKAFIPLTATSQGPSISHGAGQGGSGSGNVPLTIRPMKKKKSRKLDSSGNHVKETGDGATGVISVPITGQYETDDTGTGTEGRTDIVNDSGPGVISIQKKKKKLKKRKNRPIDNIRHLVGDSTCKVVEGMEGVENEAHELVRGREQSLFPNDDAAVVDSGDKKNDEPIKGQGDILTSRTSTVASVRSKNRSPTNMYPDLARVVPQEVGSTKTTEQEESVKKANSEVDDTVGRDVHIHASSGDMDAKSLTSSIKKSVEVPLPLSNANVTKSSDEVGEKSSSTPSATPDAEEDTGTVTKLENAPSPTPAVVKPKSSTHIHIKLKPVPDKTRKDTPPTDANVDTTQTTPEGALGSASDSAGLSPLPAENVERSQGGESKQEKLDAMDVESVEQVVQKNESFDKKIDAHIPSTESAGINSDDQLNNSKQSASDSSSEDDGVSKQSGGRGRRAAQKANEKIAAKEERVIANNKRGRKRRKEKEDGRRGKKVRDEEAPQPDNENWVQCNRCEKWRLVPSLENLPDKWYCELNVTDLLRNNCEAPEQTPQEVEKERRKKKRAAARNQAKRGRSMSPAPGVTKGLKSSEKIGDVSDKRRQSPSLEKTLSETSRNSDSGDEQIRSRNSSRLSLNEDSNAENEDITKPPRKPGRRGRPSNDEKGARRGRKKQKEEKQQEWVQCEKCEQWRRLPSFISAEDLPDKWFCSMNTWDPRSASCAVREDYKLEEEKNRDRAITDAAKEKMPSVSGNRLTYRTLIRRPTREKSERMRAAESIFSNTAAEIDGEGSGNPPVVLYANSSVFQQKSHFGRIVEQPEDENATSLFALMSQSQMWRDLYNGMSISMGSPHSVTSSANLGTDPTTVTEVSASMKAMISFALGSKEMAVNEILLECQCREWGHDKWMDLRSTCTYDSVSRTVDALVNDGLMEVVGLSADGIGAGPRYRNSNIGGNEKLSMRESRGKSRCIKLSKPWKKGKISYNHD